MQNFVLPNMYTKHWNLSTLYHIHPQLANTRALYTLQISLCHSPYIAIDLQPMLFMICDDPYLYLCTIKPACLHNSVLGVVNKAWSIKSMISSICDPAYVSRFCQFSVDNDNNDNNRQTDRLLYPLCMRNEHLHSHIRYICS